MARIRTIKPEFCTSLDVAALSLPARLFFILLLTQVDDEGRLLYLPRTLAPTMYPHDEQIDASSIREWVAELVAQGMLTEYSVRAQGYLMVTNFLKHQKINRPSESRLPAPIFEPDHHDSVSDSVSHHLQLSESSLSDSVSPHSARVLDRGKGKGNGSGKGRGSVRGKGIASPTPEPDLSLSLSRTGPDRIAAKLNLNGHRNLEDPEQEQHAKSQIQKLREKRESTDAT